ncbi:MAG: histidine--tRNA ligase [Longimicrobiales bacterium]
MPSTTSLPGFRDFYPAELSVRNHITNAWREASRRYGFEEYDGPPLESLDLYVEKSGQEIVAQLYNFEDKGGRAVALRPEMTPSLARMVGARAGGLRKPIRWFSIPQLFRYERTQRGRLREHFQWNADILGEHDIGADAEVLAVALDALRTLGLGPHDIVARFNDRRLLEKLLGHAGVAQDHLGRAYAAVDKLGREPEEKVRQRLGQVGMDARGIDRVFSMFRMHELDELRRDFAGVTGIEQEIVRLDAYTRHLTGLGFGEFIAFDPTIVRGLAYYTGTVFEIFDRKGELRAICGGGRYDDLLKALSGTDLPAVGFGMGDVVIAELLRERGLLPEYRPSVDYFVVAFSEAEEPLQRRIARGLRARGSSVLYGLKRAGMGKQFKEADARGARQVIVLGPEEVASGVALIREMKTGEERRVRLEELGAET